MTSVLTASATATVEIPANNTSTEVPLTTSQLPTLTELPTSVTSIINATETDSATVPPTATASLSSTTVSNETATATEPLLTTSETLTSATEIPVSTTVPVNTTEVPSETPVETTPTATLLPPTTTSLVITTPVITSIPATATITDSESWLPSTIIVELSTSLSTPTEALAPTSTAPLPSDLPKVISGPEPNVEQPKDSMLLQIGFLHGENYQHVSKNPNAAAQIFTCLPKALADAAGLDINQIRMTKLVPFDTSQTLGYITTLAKFYYPRSMVDTLRMDIKIPNSAIYNNPDQLVFNLTQNINPAIEIIPGMEDDGSSTGNDGSSSTSTPNNPNDPFGGSDDSSKQSPIQKGTAAAIGIGAVGVAAAYGAAMFIIARRYKQKKQAHRRASSVTSSEMRYTGAGSPPMMGGALMSRDFSNYGGVAGGVPGGRESHGSGQTGRSGMGNSARTAYISAPVAAENSLGWN
ncbi:hypothetical protein CH063_03734 [Colletotrichum higginsianum]|nr:hypothetical protein CH063_03734 [Colletotrichum higginsianum]